MKSYKAHKQKTAQKSLSQLFKEMRQLTNTPRMKGITVKELKEWVHEGRRY